MAFVEPVILAAHGVKLVPLELSHEEGLRAFEGIVAIEGTVTRFDWRNPHVYVAVMDQQGREWLLETDGTAVLGRSGWTSQSFRVGDRVIARGVSQFPGLRRSLWR